MKKTVALVLFVSLLFSCSVTYIDPALENTKLSEGEKQFITQFENVVLKHKKKKFIDMLEPTYKQEQFEDMYHGDVNNFVSDFFCGKDGQKFKCFSMGQIDKIELLDYSRNGDIIMLKFRVYSGSSSIIVTDIQVKRYRTKDGKIKYGIIGAYG